MCPFLETMLPMWLGCLPAQARLACPCFKWPALGPGSTSISFSASRLYSQKYFRQKLQTNAYKYNPRLTSCIDLNWRSSAIVVNPHQEILANTLGSGSSCYFLNMHFFRVIFDICIIFFTQTDISSSYEYFKLTNCIFAISLASSQSSVASQSDAF